MRNEVVFPALHVLSDGTRDVLGSWLGNTEGAKFWSKVFNDLKTCSMGDILIAASAGLKCMAEALAVIHPATTLKTCIVQLICRGLDHASSREHKQLGRQSSRSTRRPAPKLLPPLVVLHVGPAARHVLDVARIDEQHGDAARLHQFKQRYRVHASRFHDNRVDAMR